LVVPYIAAFIFTPVLGVIMSANRNVSRGKFILISSFCFLATHLMFALIPNCYECILSIIPLITLGLCFSVFATIIVPSIPIFINDE
jgi:membrane protein CcdC involved in cytochrome C biogenesis